MIDEFGLEYTTNCEQAPALFTEVLENYLGSSAQTMPCLDHLLAVDPEMPMALIFRAYLLKSASDPRFRTPIKKCFDAVAGRADLNERERRHRLALEYWQQDQLIDTVSVLDDIVKTYPRDMLALRIAHHLHFYGAGAIKMTGSLIPASKHWNASDRFFGYFKGMQSFALEESGNYKEAETAGIEALEFNNTDIWAAHAVTHVYHMQKRFAEGSSFIDSLTDVWSDKNNFVNHLYWHKALLHIGLKEFDVALKIYDDFLIEPLTDDFYLDVCNAASLLWRLEMLGVNLGQRWSQLMAYSTRRVTDDELVFTTLHYLMAPAILEDNETTTHCLGHFSNWLSSATTQGEVAKSVGATMAQAIVLLAKKQHVQGARLMQSVRDQIHLIGGSHAQRHLFEQLITHYA